MITAVSRVARRNHRDQLWANLLVMAAQDRPFSLQQQAREMRAETLKSLIRGISTMFSIAKFKAWRQRRAYVRELMELDDHALADIGLVRGDLQEIARGTFDPAIQEARRTWTLRSNFHPVVSVPENDHPPMDRAA